MKKQTGLETTPLTCEALLKTTEGVAGDDRADHVSESLAPENNEYACTPDSAGNAVTLTGTMLSTVTCHLASIYWQLEAQAPAGSTKEAGTPKLEAAPDCPNLQGVSDSSRCNMQLAQSGPV